MVISERARFWLKVALTITFPLWIFPACAAVLVMGVAMLVWGSVEELVDDLTSDGEADA